MTKTSISIFDFDDDGWSGVDAWESPGILAAAEAHKAEEQVTGVKDKLESAEKSFAKCAAEAKDRMDEMAALLKKVELSTATKEEMERLSKLDDEMKRLKVDLTESKSAIKTYQEEIVKSESKAKTYDLMKTAKEHDIKSVIRSVREAEQVDLAFLLDCTSSMHSYIDSAKSSMQEIVRRVKRTNTGLQLRVAVVGYRDLCDRNRFEVLDFTSSVTDFETFVSGLRAIGGGDSPEDIAGAVRKANALSWMQTSRVTFLIADCPCHGTKYHLFGSDENYPGGTPGICIETELNNLLKKGGDAGMQLQFGRITEYCDTMIRVLGEKGINFDICGLDDPRKLSSSVASSVRKSISKSVTASKSKSKTGAALDLLEEGEVAKKEYTIQETKPSVEEWNSLTALPVKVLCNKPITSIDDLNSPLHFGMIRWGTSASAEMEEVKMLMRRAKDPFAEGELRLAYYGKIGPNEVVLSSDKGDKILKSFKKTRNPESEKKHYLGQMEVSTIAHFLAEEYNKTCRPEHCAEIRFLQVHIVETETERFCAEDQLPCAATAFMKYSNNTGYWNEDEINQSLLLFTQFTHDKTGGYLMVTDLQGVRNGNQFILTDPAILCKDSTRFGNTNLGGKLMDKCMASTKAMLEEYGWDD